VGLIFVKESPRRISIPLDLSSLSRAVHVCVQSSTTRRSVPRVEDSEGTAAPRSVTDSTDQWVWCFMHMRFMLHVISLICLV
jgi:hypothetical protein